VQLDGELVAEVRSRFAAVLMRSASIRASNPPRAQRVPLGGQRRARPAGVGLFVRDRANASPTASWFFTVDGSQGLLPSLSVAAKNVVSESWCRQRVEFDPNGPQMRALQRDVIALRAE